MPIWSDFFRLFQYASEKDPLAARKDPNQFGMAGISQPEAIGTDFAAGTGPSGTSSYRQTYDMIDTTTLSNRAMRYKEYERLRNVPEIEMAITVFADEACVAGDTKIATPFGFITIKELAEKKADERFLVYCYDFNKNDYTLGWAYAPRLVKRDKTIQVTLDDGSTFTATSDHRVLKKDGKWIETGELKFGDELMPFYRKSVNEKVNELRTGHFPRIFSFNRGWIHERQFVDDWKSGHTATIYERANRAIRMIGGKIPVRQIAKRIGHDWKTIEDWFQKIGFTHKEIRYLYGQHKDRRKVIDVCEGPEQDVYDISVSEHKCFATNSVILHNCQKDENGNILKVSTTNDQVKEELEFLFYNRKMLNLNRNGWTWFKNLCISGDWFLELVVNPDNPKEGIYKAVPLPVETMYRIETVRGRLVEFQQSKEGPDYQAIVKPIDDQNEKEVSQTTAIRFSPSQIVHFRIGDDRKTFYPYGQSLIEPARAPAHSLRLMEDAMVTYRLARAPERRVFYIDVGQLPPFKAEAFIDRIKDQFRKRKIANSRGNTPGANSVEERWQPPAQDEDYWLPVRPNNNTRIETLPGAENLGEIDDAIYFRNKLLTALNFPKTYLSNEDVNITKISLSAQDIKFARMIERLQSHFEDGLLDLAERHLELRGYPQDSYQDLKIKMTPPSDWREMSRSEVVTARYSNAGSLKSSQLMSDYDIMTKILRYSADDTDEMLGRLKIQKLEDLKLQVLAQNPQLLGVGIPSQDQQGSELGTEAGGPTNMPSPEGMEGLPPEGMQPQGTEGMPPENMQQAQKGQPTVNQNMSSLPTPNDEDIKKYNLEIQDYEIEQDYESIDFSVGG